MNEISFFHFPIINTENLILSRLKTEDADAIFILRSDNRVLEYLEREKCKSVEEAREFISKINDGIEKNNSFYWGIRKRKSKELMGTICFWNFSNDYSKAEIGYELIPDYQGKGIIQEAINAVIPFGFENLKLQQIDAYVHYQNSRSIKVLERNGFTLMHEINKDAANMIVYGLEKEAWSRFDKKNKTQ